MMVSLFFSQLTFSQSTLNSKINPLTSNGYIMWEKTLNANSYVIKYYAENNGSYTFKGRKKVTNNYAKLHVPYFLEDNMYYTVSSLDANGNNIDESGYQPMHSGEIFNTPYCEKKCVGTTYAWKAELNVNEFDVPQNIQLRPTAKYSYLDTITDIMHVVPFYQAISTNAQELMDGHPYFSSSEAGSEIYDIITIDNEIIENSGPFFSASGTVVTSGVLVGKKMDQFNYMQTINTAPSATPSLDLCTYALNNASGWIPYYNNTAQWPIPHVPTGSNTFYNIPLQTELECTPSYSSASEEDWVSDNNWLEWYGSLGGLRDTLLLDHFITFTFLTKIVDSTDINYINIKSLDKRNPNEIQIIKNENSNIVLAQSQNIQKGLYKLIATSESGQIIPFTFEVMNDVQITSESDFASIKIYPNPIQDNSLKFEINTLRPTNAQLTVLDLNGNVYYSKQVQLRRGIDLLQNINVGNGIPPYNQLIINLTFSDGSVLQETALKLN